MFRESDCLTHGEPEEVVAFDAAPHEGLKAVVIVLVLSSIWDSRPWTVDRIRHRMGFGTVIEGDKTRCGTRGGGIKRHIKRHKKTSFVYFYRWWHLHLLAPTRIWWSRCRPRGSGPPVWCVYVCMCICMCIESVCVICVYVYVYIERVCEWCVYMYMCIYGESVWVMCVCMYMCIYRESVFVWGGGERESVWERVCESVCVCEIESVWERVYVSVCLR
jgi:hypothetical protein